MLDCIHCRNKINRGAQICPYCHMDPWNWNATEPYTGLRGNYYSDGPDPVALAVLGLVCLPVPVLGVGLLAAAALVKIFKR